MIDRLQIQLINLHIEVKTWCFFVIYNVSAVSIINIWNFYEMSSYFTEFNGEISLILFFLLHVSIGESYWLSCKNSNIFKHCFILPISSRVVFFFQISSTFNSNEHWTLSLVTLVTVWTFFHRVRFGENDTDILLSNWRTIKKIPQSLALFCAEASILR